LILTAYEEALKTILCYGDSNTWGCRDDGPYRYSLPERWPGILQARLGSDYHVIEEGLPGRTTVLDDPYEESRNGLTYLRPCLDSHNPEMVLLLLGTNDLKRRFDISAWDIAMGAARLVRAILGTPCAVGGRPPEVCLMAPPPVLEIGPYASMFEGASAKSRELPALYRKVAEETGALFVDASSVVEPSPTEGLHWRQSEHVKLAEVLAESVRRSCPAR
jgi:lysophospholipase L1-like esterase